VADGAGRASKLFLGQENDHQDFDGHSLEKLLGRDEG